MRIKTKLKRTEGIPNDSLADIAFLLIIFFMVTTAFAARKGIDFQLPKQEKTQNMDTEQIESTLIHITDSGRLLVDDRPLNLEDIQPYLMPKLAVNPKKFVIIQTDDEAAYGDMIDVLDELKQANVQNIVLPTKAEIASWGDYL